VKMRHQRANVVADTRNVQPGDLPCCPYETMQWQRPTLSDPQHLAVKAETPGGCPVHPLIEPMVDKHADGDASECCCDAD
jgi:hypothetical protein